MALESDMSASAFFREFVAAVSMVGEVRDSPCPDITTRSHLAKAERKHGIDFARRVESRAARITTELHSQSGRDDRLA